jgi:hypothetical protein
MDKKCNDNLFVKPIEYCSFHALKNIHKNFSTENIYIHDNLDLFKPELSRDIPDLNSKFRSNNVELNINNEYIFNYDGEKDNPDRNKNLCGKTNNIEEYYVNCVLQTSNSLFTYKDGYCIVSPEINLPKQLKKIEEKNETIIKLDRRELEDEEGNFKYEKIQNNKYCEDRWYDWIIIPNYHFGNRILKDSGAYSKEDVKVCYDNCKEGELPYINSSGKKFCVPKEIAYEGMYENKLDYSTIALINLIGNSKNNLNLLYKNLYFYKINKKLNNYLQNDNVKLSNNLETSNNYIINEAFEKIKGLLHKFVNEENLEIPDYSMEYKNLTYKNPNLKENDLISLLGMDKNEILTNDIILIHTAYISYKIYKFIKDLMTTPNILNNTTTNKLDFSKFDNNDFNINKVLLNYDNDKKIFENDTKKRYIQRLANILYKAININYNNKTDFSKNLIKRTKEALIRYEKPSIGTSLINFNDVEMEKYFKFKENIDEISNGFEIDFYKYNYLQQEFYINKHTEYINDNPEYFQDIFKQFFITKFLIYTEEESEIIKGSKCKSGEINIPGTNPGTFKCEKCTLVCDTKNKCKDPNCKIFCESTCNKVDDDNEKTKCGGTTKTDDEYIKPQPHTDIKTPIEEETNIPDISYILKTSIRIFFVLISLYIAYMFYKLFNESILTIGNLLFRFLEAFIYNRLFYNKIKIAEHYENIIQGKYNTIIRKTMT